MPEGKLKFRIYQSERDELWYWSAVDSNGETVADGSEGYGYKDNVEQALDQIIYHITEGQYEIEVVK